MHFTVLTLLIASVIGQGGQTVWAHEGKNAHKPETVFGSDQSPLTDPDDMDLKANLGSMSIGETVYKHMCVFCHGADGNANADACGTATWLPVVSNDRL